MADILSSLMQRILAGFMVLVTWVLSLFSLGLEPYMETQIAASVAYIPWALVSYPFRPKTSEEVDAVKAKSGGFIKGICHPTDEYEQIKGAGIEWNRADIPFPFESDGVTLQQSYIDWKARMQRFRDSGINIMAVTPYPRSYISAGFDPRTPEGEEKVKEIARFFVNDLRGLVGAFQITNEMGIPRFQLPLTTEEAVRFMAVNLEAMYPIKGDILVGYNSAGPQADQHLMMKPYLEYCDYVGIDIYLGCFFSFGNYMFLFDLMLDYLWSFTGKPIILCEFGYISGGAPKTAEEKQAILEGYGVSSEAEARANIEAFVDALPARMQSRVRNEAGGDWGNYIFNTDFALHLYREMPADVVLPGYPHTPEGQAKFYADIIPRMTKSRPYLIGAFVYCWQDSASCYVCGQSDCPIETRWGLVDMNNGEKPAYNAVRDAFANIK